MKKVQILLERYNQSHQNVEPSEAACGPARRGVLGTFKKWQAFFDIHTNAVRVLENPFGQNWYEIDLPSF